MADKAASPKGDQPTCDFKAASPTNSDHSSVSYTKFSYRAVATLLQKAVVSGKLGEGAAEHNSAALRPMVLLFQTTPWSILLFQLIWSVVVTAIAFVISINKDRGGLDVFDNFHITLTADFWKTRFSVSSSVCYGVGWALFVLLGFFIREASTRFFEAQVAITRIELHFRQLVRTIRHVYPSGTWHDNDHDRIVAHMIAFPITLKMSLREERDASQINTILHPDDVHDVLTAESMHIHCSRVIRAYLTAAEEDALVAFQHTRSQSTPAGRGVRYFVIDLLDAVDKTANAAARIAEFRPAIAYSNHLYIFLYIWLMFLPLALVSTSGWFTVLWSLLISYGVAMIFKIAKALNNPYGLKILDIDLTRMCAKISNNILTDYISPKLELTNLVHPAHQTPFWLEKPFSGKIFKSNYTNIHSYRFSISSLISSLKRLRLHPLRKGATLSLLAFTAWSAFIIFLTWGLTKDQSRQSGVRWWSLYIPVDMGTMAYVGLGVFLMLSFWINDAYTRYWNGLQEWQVTLRPGLEDFAFQLSIANSPGEWHHRDRERIYSHLVALPFATKLVLRGTRDLSELNNILAPKDYLALAEAVDPVAHVFNVIYAYLNSADAGLRDLHHAGSSPYQSTVYTLMYTLWNVESSIAKCKAIRSYPMSPSFTVHLRTFTGFWLSLLPLSVVQHGGFLSFLFIIPIAYSIINLLVIGQELSDPFGLDRHDIPLDIICDEIRDSLHRTYRETLDVKNLVHQSNYRREIFSPKRKRTSERHKYSESTDYQTGISSTSEDVMPTVRGSLKKILDAFPSVSLTAQVAATLWTFIAVFVSWRLSKIWNDDRNQDRQYGWSSPIDVDGNVLSNVGFALFMILAFRASDAINRYDDGAELIFEMEMQLRNFALSIIQSFEDNSFHPADKERIVAHLVQIPLCFRDLLLGIQCDSTENDEGLLSDEDSLAFRNSISPLDHLIQVVEAYAVVQDVETRSNYMEREACLPVPISMTIIQRMSKIRETTAKALGVKRFPVILSYLTHQQVFTGLWLVLLPLSMTNHAGFFTLLWAPIITYGVLGLESIAAKLVDPYGRYSTDIPVNQLCISAANSIIEAVHSVHWGYEYHTRPSPLDSEPHLGVVLKGRDVEDEFTLTHFKTRKSLLDNTDECSEFAFGGPSSPKMKPSLYAHFLRSVPWWVLLLVTVWTIFACVLSYVSRRRNETAVRWWVSQISMGHSVASYVSIATFALLGFYVRAAFDRYNAAGSVWGDKLRASCHFLAHSFLSVAPDGVIHKGDHDRILGHIAAIPLVLKAQLRDSRDIREIHGLLSNEDVGRIECSASMIAHCVDVLRSYYFKIFCWSDTLPQTEWATPNAVMAFINNEIIALEKATRSSMYLKSFGIAPGFIVLLKTLLGIWFFLLPFATAELSGWFTILWVPLIAYGLLGMYWIARELQYPFGTDLNDLDLDSITYSIVSDVLFVRNEQRNGWSSLIIPSPVSQHWQQPSIAKKVTQRWVFENRETMSRVSKWKEAFRLASKAVKWWIMAAVLAWSIVAVSLAYIVSRFWMLGNGDDDCPLRFCSRIAVEENVKEYVGYALFLLLGFRLYDSHWRYVRALQLWQDGIIGQTRLLANRLFESYTPGTWHEGDLERIAGHLAAYSVCLMGSLRKMDYKELLLQILSEEDVKRILVAEERVGHCMDVVWAYLRDGVRLEADDKLVHPCGANEHYAICLYLRRLEDAALECQQMIRIPLPFGYVQHLRIFLIIWLLLLPLALVESSGWVTIGWIPFIAYGVIGVEHWAQELSDPFGFDVSDVPLEILSARVVQIVKENLDVFRRGMEPFIREDRPGFSSSSESMSSVEP